MLGNEFAFVLDTKQAIHSNENPMMTAVFESLIKPKIDIAQGRYEEKVNAGKSFGRKKTVDDE